GGGRRRRMTERDEAIARAAVGVVAAQRARNARALTLVRTIASAVFLGVDVFGYVRGDVDEVATLPVYIVYFVTSAALMVAARQSTWVLERSWLALSLLDLPLVFAIQYIGAPLTAVPRVSAVFTGGVYSVIIFAAVLSMQRRYIIAATIV